MIPRQVEELARQRHAELLVTAPRPRPDNPRDNSRPTLRVTVGWSIVTIGLKIAALR